MFVGHFAVGFAAKRLAPRVPLPALLIACQFSDVLWPLFLLLGVEKSSLEPGITKVSPLYLEHIPFSHSLVAVLAWSALYAAPFWLKAGPRSGGIVASAVFSHYVLDVASHHPDMPIAPGSDVRLGLGLWNSVPATLLVEGALWAAGVAYFARGSFPTSAWGRWGFRVLVALLSVAWIGNVFGPPPPSMGAVIGSVLVLTVLIVPWSWAIDRGRRFVDPERGPVPAR